MLFPLDFDCYQMLVLLKALQKNNLNIFIKN